MSSSGSVRGVSIGSRIWQLTAVACTALAVLGILVAWSLERSHDDHAWVAHDQSVQTALSSYGREIIEAETGQRGYLLMGQNAYLAPYNDALAANGAQFNTLKALIGEQSERVALARLEQILQQKFRELGLTVRLSRSGHRATRSASYARDAAAATPSSSIASPHRSPRARPPHSPGWRPMLPDRTRTSWPVSSAAA